MTRISGERREFMRSAAAVAFGLVVADTVLVPGTAGAAATGIDWQPCPDVPEVLCGTLEVPLDWAEPDGPTTRLALAMRPATDPASRLGSVVFDPGGPGGSGVSWVKSDRVVTEPVYARFDVVGFDPRGVGGSEQVRCDRARSEEADAVASPPRMRDRVPAGMPHVGVDLGGHVVGGPPPSATALLCHRPRERRSSHRGRDVGHQQMGRAGCVLVDVTGPSSAAPAGVWVTCATQR